MEFILKPNKNVTREQLEEVGFQFINGVWEYRRCVYKKQLELMVRFWLPDEEDNKSYVNSYVVNKGTNEVYAGYYNDFGVNEINSVIDRNVKNSISFLCSKGILIPNRKRNRKREE